MQAVIGALRAVLGLDSTAFDKGIGQAQKQVASLNRSFQKAASDMQAIGSTMSLAITAPVLAAGGMALRAAGNFEEGMNRVRAATQATGDDFAKLSALALEIGKSTSFSATEAASAIEALAKNGATTEQILSGAADATVRLAAANGGQLAPSADIITDTMNNFHKTAAQLPDVVNGVTGALIQSKFGFDDYKLAIGQAAGVAGKLGVSFEDFNASIAVTSSAFSSGSDAGTSYKTFLQRLVPQSKEAADAMKILGLNFFEANGAMKSQEKVADELQKAFKGLSDKSRNEAAAKIFGTDAIRTALGLAEAGAAGIRKMREEIAKTSAADQAATRLQGFNGALRLLKASIESLEIAIGNSGFLAWATNITNALTDFVRRIAALPPETLKFVTTIAGIAAAGGPAILALAALTSAVGSLGAMVARYLPGAASLVATVLPWARVALVLVSVAGAVGLFGDQMTIAANSSTTVADVLAAIATKAGGAQGALAGVSAELGKFRDYLSGLIPDWLKFGQAWDALAGSSIADTFRTTAQELDGIANAIRGTIAVVPVLFDQLGPSISGSITRIFYDLSVKVLTFVNTILAKINEVLAKIGKDPIAPIDIKPLIDDNVGSFEKLGAALRSAFLGGFRKDFEAGLDGILAAAAQNAYKRQIDQFTPQELPPVTSKDFLPKPPPPGSGGTGGRNVAFPDASGNALANSLQRITEEKKALDAATAFLQSADKTSSEQLFAAASELERIGTKTAEMLKGLDPDSATAKTIVAKVTALEQARTSYQKLTDAIKLGFATEAQYGNGVAAHTETMRQLNAALATGALGQDAYTEAVKQASYALADQQNKAIGAKGGFDGFMAGFADSANQAARNNTMFEQGKAGFQEFTGAITEASSALFQADADVGQILSRMLQRIAEFAFQTLALKPIFDNIAKMISESLNPPASSGGGAGGILGSIFSGIGSLFGGGFGAAGIGGVNGAGGIIPYGGTYAGGGEVSPGSWYRINEKGQEGFIPGSRGQILSHDEMQGGNGGQVVQHNNFALGLTPAIRAEIASQLPRLAEAGANAAAAKRKRGGTYARAFQ